MRGPVWRRIVAWSEMAVLFALLYVGVPWAGLQVDRWLRVAPWPSPIPWIGLGLFAVGVAGLAWCFALFARVGRGTPNPTAPPAVLVTVGPYAWTRNPIAMSHAAALIGLSVLVGSVSAVAIVVALAVPVHLAMLREEATLEARFGDAYRAYAARVPRWLPRPPRRHR
ncbi:MAG TPA: isoprenylcysteine carboxylmethyltransferase family protein [Thermoplasmata archaeon]